MSTFDGVVQEFPYIQIDYFRKNPERPPPLACFLSHVHSDHLQGLESFRAPFIYCSSATRELLLRIEKYPHRMNFSKGILESRRLHYKHLAKLLRPIPLDTPTEIELTPRLSIRVTLLDANHCPGAAMFLIEGNGKAILYTGDIRAESWWVNSLVRHPILIPYTLGDKRLDKIYLDTTFARATKTYHAFPSKAEGLKELLQQVGQYPPNTIFYFRAWTFGYEDVWVALSAALRTKVHVDRYQMGLFKSLAKNAQGNEAAALCGFELGNRFIPGCLSDDETCRIHSCEPGVPCSSKSKKVVEIHPIVSRTEGGLEIPEVGVGGGGGDLYQIHELLLPDKSSIEELERLCSEKIHDTNVLTQTRETLLQAFNSKSKTLSLDKYGLRDDTDIPLEKLVSVLSHGQRSAQPDKLPHIISFPYSRHSSYTELCDLVSAFRPKDVFPCTVDPLWTEDVSIQNLFGHLCSGDVFSHDAHMRVTLGDESPRKKARLEESQSQSNTQQSSEKNFGFAPPTQVESIKPTIPSISSSTRISLPSSLETIKSPPLHPQPETESKHAQIHQAKHFLDTNINKDIFHINPLPWQENKPESPKPSIKNGLDGTMDIDLNNNNHDDDTPEDTQNNKNSQLSALSIPVSAFSSPSPEPDEETPPSNTTAPSLPTLPRSHSSQIRRAAYRAARADTFDAWTSISLVSVNGHTEEEIEL